MRGTSGALQPGALQRTPSPPSLSRTTDYLQRDAAAPALQPLANSTRTNALNPGAVGAAGTAMRPVPQTTPRPQPSGPLGQRAQGQVATQQARSSSSGSRPLLPGAMLRNGRYRLQELQERQDWLSGVFEATWIGKDAQRGNAQVMIVEVVLPETTSVMAQSILRTATMTLASVGRHPRIPALWDAFSDQGHNFFVFEQIEGESLAQRLRFMGRPLTEYDVIECCLQMTEVLELLSQQSPQLVHGLIRPEHIIVSRNGSQYYLTNFSIVLAGGATQFVAGMERTKLSSYTAPEVVRGVIDARTDLYSLIATAYHAATGAVPAGQSSSILPAQRMNGALSSEFDGILMKGLRSVANQRYQRPSELRHDLLALRSVSGSLVPSNTGTFAEGSAPAMVPGNSQRAAEVAQNGTFNLMQSLPIRLETDDSSEERVLLLPKPEELPPMKAGNDQMNAAIWLTVILASFILLVILSHMLA